MGNVVIILGASGTGKSTSIKTLDPKETVIINVLSKRLPFKGSQKLYNKENKNLFNVSDSKTIVSYIKGVSDKCPNVKNFVIDDCIYTLRKEYFATANQTGFTRYNLMAAHFQSIVEAAETSRDDLNVFLILHTEDVISDGSIVTYKASTIGKLIDNAYNPIEVVPMVLFSTVRYNEKKEAEYGFITKRCMVGNIEIPAKCFAKGTLIRMADLSLKPIEEIQVGDYVLNSDSKPSKVSTLHSGVSDMYRITQARGIDYVVNQEHLLCTDKGVIAAKDVFSSEKSFNGIHGKYDGEWDIEEPYFLGLWLGDGAKDHTSITTMEPEVEEYLKNLAEKYQLRFGKYKKEDSKASEINLGSDLSYSKEVFKYSKDGVLIKKYDSIKEAAIENNLLASNISHCAAGRYKSCGGFVWKYGEVVKHNGLKELLRKYDLLYNKHIPEDFEFASLSSKLEFIAGLIDSDGYKSDNVYEFSTQYLHVAENLTKICNSCGFDTFISSFIIKKYDKVYYKVRISGNVNEIPTRVLRRKINKPSREKNAIDITEAGKSDYYGFALEGDCKTFFLEDWTLVHNCPAGMFDEEFIPNDLAYVTKKMEEYYE